MQLSENNILKETRVFYDNSGNIEICNKINIPSRLKYKAQELAINHLNLKDIGELRDRFEGQAYLDKLTLSIMSLYVLEKTVNRKFLNLDNFKNKRNFSNEYVDIVDDKFKLFTFFLGEVPIKSGTDVNPLIVIGISPDLRFGSVYGYIKDYCLTDKSLFRCVSSPVQKNRNMYVGFNKLIKIENLFI